MRFYPILFLLCLTGFLASCQHDPMEQYEELGVPKGFTKDTYKRDVMKNSEKPGGFSFFTSQFQEEQERKRKFRDVSRPLDKNAVTIFPWSSSGKENRSEELHQEIRRESGRNTPLIW